MRDAHAPQDDRDILIAGAGIGGLSAAFCLARLGHAVHVIERVAELGEVGAGILLGPNASGVLYARGLGEALDARSAPVIQAEIGNAAGDLFVARDLSDAGFHAPFRMIHRAALHQTLLDAARDAGARITLGVAVEGFELGADAGAIRATLSDGRHLGGRALIGADGVHSALRAQLLDEDAPRYHGYTCWRGITDAFEHPDFAHHTLRELQGRGARIGTGYLDAERVYWWATANAPAGIQDTPETLREDLHDRFEEFPPFFHAMLEHTPVDAILRNDIYDRRPTGHWGEGALTLLGDAAHPMSPNLGQGACSAIEDAAVLATCLGPADAPDAPDIVAALRSYERRRQPRCARLQKLSKRFGDLGQWENALAVKARELAMRATPASIMEKEQAWIWGFDADATSDGKTVAP